MTLSPRHQQTFITYLLENRALLQESHSCTKVRVDFALDTGIILLALAHLCPTPIQSIEFATSGAFPPDLGDRFESQLKEVTSGFAIQQLGILPLTGPHLQMVLLRTFSNVTSVTIHAGLTHEEWSGVIEFPQLLSATLVELDWTVGQNIYGIFHRYIDAPYLRDLTLVGNLRQRHVMIPTLLGKFAARLESLRLVDDTFPSEGERSAVAQS
ncbi:hypothetical protein VNI00_002523 [Paramarasmius palmivorus]|uniref:Uncharacterized protein n=1 Tax=Paramarasmius palmivorus TaxID=297713 RepID=A0AAW0DXN6_9AGAR